MRTRTLTVVLVVAVAILGYIWMDRGTSHANEREDVEQPVLLKASAGPRSARFTEGLQALAGGETTQAETIFLELVRAQQDLPTSLVFLGKARFERGDYRGAREAAEIVAGRFEEGRDREEARNLLRECDRIEGVEPKVLTEGLDSGQVAEAIASSESIDALIEKIEGLAREGRLDEATAVTQSSIENLARFGGGESAWARIEPFVRRLDALQAQRAFDPRGAFWKVAYTLRPGETLSHVSSHAQRLGHKGFGVGFLQAVNRIRDPRTIPAGAVLKIPDQALSVRIHRDARVVLVFAGAELVRVYPCAIGKEGHDTPTGEFVIVEKDPKPHWYAPGGGRVDYGHPDNPLGEGWLGFADTPEHKGYGIHGNNDETSIGKRASRGCIRLRNADIVELFSWVPSTGTRVVIL